MIESTSPKLFESLRNLGGSILAMVQTRLELATVELAEERVRLMKIALYGLFGLLLFGLALITLTLLLIIVFCAVWTAVEFYGGQVMWGTIFMVVTAYAGASLLLFYRPKEESQSKGEAAGETTRDTTDGTN